MSNEIVNFRASPDTPCFDVEPLIFSGAYESLSCFTSKLYKADASAPCMAWWKSGLFLFTRPYNVNWLTHNISNWSSLMFLLHRLPAASSKSRNVRIFLTLEEGKSENMMTNCEDNNCHRVLYLQIIDIGFGVIFANPNEYAETAANCADQFIVHCNQNSQVNFVHLLNAHCPIDRFEWIKCHLWLWLLLLVE